LPVVVLVSIFAALLLRKTKLYRKWAENIWINLIFIGDIIKQRAQASFLSSTAFLLQGGLPITAALSLAKGAVPSAWLHAKINRLAQQVEAGNSLYDAMMQDPEQIWSAQMLALIKVGQESGSLVPVLQKGANMYQTNINKSLNRIATIIQPTLMLILGLLITLLIIALYEPIFTLSYVVGI
jgi:type II secretory pathway component PulF